MTQQMAVRMAELLGEGVPFVAATVVRAQPPTSASPGDAAVVLADGSIEGFVGGQCARESVRAAALDVLASGEPLLLRILPDGEVGFPDSPGARVVVNPCLSGGALEIFLEPRPRALGVAVVGDTPIAHAVAAQADSLGFAFDLVPSLWESPPAGAVAAIVASHGRDEPESIRSALEAGVPFVGLVASRTRGEAVLAGMDLTTEERARVHSPVGLEIGARTAAEIALSIMAQVVGAIRSGEISVPVRGVGGGVGGAGGGEADVRPLQAVDPVCGMTVVVGASTPHLVVGGDEYWFCCTGCRDRFAA